MKNEWVNQESMFTTETYEITGRTWDLLTVIQRKSTK